jgi:hypothetical protein
MTIQFRWLGELFEGERACWNPKQRVLYLSWHYTTPELVKFIDDIRYSRLATRVLLLKNIEDNFPAVFLDGDVW